MKQPTKEEKQAWECKAASPKQEIKGRDIHDFGPLGKPEWRISPTTKLAINPKLGGLEWRISLTSKLAINPTLGWSEWTISLTRLAINPQLGWPELCRRRAGVRELIL